MPIFLVFQVLEKFWRKGLKTEEQTNYASVIKDVLTGSIAKNTYKKYVPHFEKWMLFAERNKFQPLPAKSKHFLLYLAELISESKSSSIIESSVAAFKWFQAAVHNEDPSYDKIFSAFIKYSKKHNKSKANKKLPFNIDMLYKVLDHLVPDIKNVNEDNMLNMRNAVFFLLSFAGFLRSEEALALKRRDIVLKKDYLKIYVRKSKCDQIADGTKVLINKSLNKKYCPYRFVSKFFHLMPFKPDNYIFCRMWYCKSRNRYNLGSTNSHLSYSTMRDLLIKTLKSIKIDPKKFGLHSFRKGGATTAANRGVPDRLFKNHGRWKSENAKDGYVHDSVKKKLSVSKSLFTL